MSDKDAAFYMNAAKSNTKDARLKELHRLYEKGQLNFDDE